jgi:hypothetical protein
MRTIAQECLDHGRYGFIISANWFFQEMDREIPALSPCPFPEPERTPWLNACGKGVLNGKNWPGGQRTSAGPILCRFLEKCPDYFPKTGYDDKRL